MKKRRLWANILTIFAVAAAFSPGSISQVKDNLPKAPQRLLKLQEYEFDVLMVDREGKEVSRSRGKAKQYSEDLGNGVKLEMVAIPTGSFLMGSPENEAGRDANEGPQHQVSVKAFYMGKFEVTRGQWEEVIKLPKVRRKLYSHQQENFDYAIDVIGWDEAVEFCERLSRKTGRKYRLPTEAEWEYACRAGTTTPFHFGEMIKPELANYGGYYSDSGKSSRYGLADPQLPVGKLGIANGFGLFDMHGGVSEWCLDPYHKNYVGAPADGSVWKQRGSGDKVLRGGSFGSNPQYCRSARRFDMHKYGASGFGFRVVREITVPEDE